MYSLLNVMDDPDIIRSLRDVEVLVRHPQLDRLVKEFGSSGNKNVKIDCQEKCGLSLETALAEACAKSLEFGSLDDERSVNNQDSDAQLGAPSVYSGFGKYEATCSNNAIRRNILCKRMKDMISCVQKDVAQIEKLDDKRGTNRVLLHHAYDDYLKALEKYMEFKVSDKNELDSKMTNQLCFELYRENGKQRLAKKEEQLASCSTKEEVARRSSRYTALKKEISDLQVNLDVETKRLEAFKSLDPEVLKEFEDAKALLKEKQWLMSVFHETTL